MTRQFTQPPWSFTRSGYDLIEVSVRVYFFGIG